MSGIPETYRHQAASPPSVTLSPEDDIPPWNSLEVCVRKVSHGVESQDTTAPILRLIGDIRTRCNGSLEALVISPTFCLREDDDGLTTRITIHRVAPHPRGEEALGQVNDSLRRMIHRHAAGDKNGTTLTVTYKNGEHVEKEYPPPPWQPPHHTFMEYAKTLLCDLPGLPRELWRILD